METLLYTWLVLLCLNFGIITVRLIKNEYPLTLTRTHTGDLIGLFAVVAIAAWIVLVLMN